MCVPDNGQTTGGPRGRGHLGFVPRGDSASSLWRWGRRRGKRKKSVAGHPTSSVDDAGVAARNPRDTFAFAVKSERHAWQEAWAVAANPQGMLRQLSIGGPALFGRQGREVPEVSDDYIANAVDRGTFVPWLERNAKAMHGMSVVVGRGRVVYYTPDRLYAVIKLPLEPRTYKLVIGWRDHNNCGNG